jgi:hypothetical protein
MEKVNARRGFLKGFGLFSAIAGGVSVPVLAQASTGSAVRHAIDRDITPPVDQALAPLGLTTLQLSASNKPPLPPSNGYSFTSMANLDANSVKMSVGKDNRLWVEVDGTWRRVALEA